MSGTGEPDRQEPAVPERLRRRLDAVFGDVLPDVTRDEAPEPAGPASRESGPAGSGSAAEPPGGAGSSRQDEWLRANRPPHHDRD